MLQYRLGARLVVGRVEVALEQLERAQPTGGEKDTQHEEP